MKQKLFNWIHRVLRKWGVKSTEYVNIDDLFEKVKALQPDDKVCSLSVTQIWHNHTLRKGTTYYVNNEIKSFSADTFEQAFEQYKIAQVGRGLDISGTSIKEVNV